jgi:hypothetical protein
MIRFQSRALAHTGRPDIQFHSAHWSNRKRSAIIHSKAIGAMPFTKPADWFADKRKYEVANKATSAA